MSSTDWIAATPAAEVLAALDDARILVSDTNDLAPLADHPQVRHRQSLGEVPVDGVGMVTMPGPLPGLVATPPRFGTDAPVLGAHTGEVLADSLSW